MQRTSNPQIEYFLTKLRDPGTAREDFRGALERLGECLGLEVARQLDQREVSVQTSLGASATHYVLAEEPVLVAILRAGLPLYHGLQRVFPEAAAGFIAAKRDETTLAATLSYAALPSLRDRTVILADTMIATGGSLGAALTCIGRHGPRRIVIVGVIASAYAVNLFRERFPDVSLVVAAVDPTLNERGYIVPGLGDAGDRCYGRDEKG